MAACYNLNTQLSHILLILLILGDGFSIHVPFTSIPDKPSTVYQILPKFGLPQGLLPDSVNSYNLFDDGRFFVELPKPCYVQFDYLVYYDQKITGKLHYGSITDLQGIQVQRLFLWFDVNGIKVDLPPSDSIYFQVGLINKKLDLSQFHTIHSCLDRNNALFSPVQSWYRAFEPTRHLDEITTIDAG